MFSENQFAKMLGVSRANVREVYSALAIFGILESRRGEGTFLNNNSILQTRQTYCPPKNIE